MKHFCLLFLALFTLCGYAQTAADVTFAIRVTVSASPVSVQLRWNKVNGVTAYTVSRKGRTETTWTTLSSNMAVNDTAYTDNTVQANVGYEYRVSNASLTVTGYVFASVALPAAHRRGKIVVLVDSAYRDALGPELRRFELDLIREGWQPVRRDIGRTQAVTAVKQVIRGVVQADPAEVKGVVILGHIPVPYSGLLNPDGHPDHRGAWPADIYYGDTSSTFWTDVSVNDTAASRPENRNKPGDGKFDQSTMPNPSITQLFVGRADVFDMPAFGANDTLLMKRYLDKDHAYRSQQTSFRMRGLIDDNFGYFSGEAFAQNGFRNMASLLGPDSVFTGDYFTDLSAGSYLWSYGCGGGWYQGAGGVGNTSNFQTDTVQTVFTLLFGSYFGDWDNQNNFLRAPLAAPGSALTNCWAGRPNAFFHHMGLGEPIGSAFLESQRLSAPYWPFGYGSRFVHQALLGDPTLTMYPYLGPGSMVADSIAGASIARLNWTASPDAQVLGYYVYRAGTLSDSFILVTPNYISGTTWNDSSALQGKNVYMVRAVKLQSGNSGRFYNLSPGMIDSTFIQTPFAVEDREQQIHWQLYPNPAASQVIITAEGSHDLLVTLSDLKGQIVRKQRTAGALVKIPLHGLNPGLYRVTIDTGRRRGTRLLTVMPE